MTATRPSRDRKPGALVKRPDDFVTLEECVRIAFGAVQRDREQREQERHAGRWYRRLWRSLRRA